MLVVPLLQVTFSTNFNPSVNNVNSDYVVVYFEDTHTYNAAGNVFSIFTDSAARFSTLVDGNNDASYKFYTRIDFGTSALRSPTTKGIPLITMIKNE